MKLEKLIEIASAVYRYGQIEACFVKQSEGPQGDELAAFVVHQLASVHSCGFGDDAYGLLITSARRLHGAAEDLRIISDRLYEFAARERTQ